MIWSLLTSRLAGPIAGAAALALGVALTVVTIEKNGLADDLSALQERYDTKADQLTKCRANTETLAGAIMSSNAEVQRIANDRTQKLEEARRAVDAARLQTAAVNTSLNRLMSAPTSGTVCERVDQVDRAVVESFQ